jgi:DNA-binding CsgD family transcriptional regulator
MTFPADIGKEIMLRRPDLLHAITPTERQVLEMLLSGKTAKEIGKAMHRSAHTVQSHAKSLYRIMEVHSREQLIILFAVIPAPSKPEAA